MFENKLAMTAFDKVLSLVLVILIVVSVGIMLYNFDADSKLQFIPSYGSGEVLNGSIVDQTIISKHSCIPFAKLSDGVDEEGFREVYLIINKSGKLVEKQAYLKFRNLGGINNEILTVEGEETLINVNGFAVTIANKYSSRDNFRENFRALHYPPSYDILKGFQHTTFRDLPEGFYFCKNKGYSVEIEESLDLYPRSLLKFEFTKGVNDFVEILFDSSNKLFDIGLKLNGKSDYWFSFINGTPKPNARIDSFDKVKNKIYLRDLNVLKDLSMAKDFKELSSKLVGVYNNNRKDKRIDFDPELEWYVANELNFNMLLYGVENVSKVIERTRLNNE